MMSLAIDVETLRINSEFSLEKSLLNCFVRIPR